MGSTKQETPDHQRALQPLPVRSQLGKSGSEGGRSKTGLPTLCLWFSPKLVWGSQHKGFVCGCAAWGSFQVGEHMCVPIWN